MVEQGDGSKISRLNLSQVCIGVVGQGVLWPAITLFLFDFWYKYGVKGDDRLMLVICGNPVGIKLHII